MNQLVLPFTNPEFIYGTSNAQDMAPDNGHQDPEVCLCGTVNCPEEYSHVTSGV